MIAVTGYSGFVGTELLKKINSEKQHLLLGRKPISGNYKHQYFDLSNAVQKLDLSGAKVLIHCAARVHIMNDNSENPIDEFRAVNTKGTLNLATQAAQAGVKRFIFISTIKVNGESTTGRKPFNEQECSPEDPYGVSKAEAEQQLQALGQQTGMEIVIIRPPLVYGEGVKANFASLMRLVNKGFPLPFRSINKNKRSLVSVYNLVDLIKVCVEHPNAANKVFLVSDDHDLSTAEMVQLMAKVQGKSNVALPVPTTLFSIAGSILGKKHVVDRLIGSLQVDITHTKDTLKWTPPYSVEDSFKLSAKN
ncbi:SDR family oxidoreductase [Pseudoalteromonas sp. CST5]|uniref:UDP-glucose 4-epimerase family protein n=1 Tax=unclassified Pseudoalteromonas TaxID=194690 RepID=UPI00235A3D9D|nr:MULTISPECIES: SDR family oxidoreductase [unclassified Pseudoalteromonas]MDC9513054.1 SDR family oxidoreductase [Pseudoalteromonas sp. CST1]MDC9537209.1 SDR family oxidoreductase [Pseudoalteromonas sp. CST3]MDC9541523.1 SDR family oxidoreductase [Pseudoalteromonas sp. CST2]MDC9544418.1 SDR family oxidoreductase [Pseudoalteromonas sp. CST4]MDC9548554.1 SDR family oxidoreductase [Pseudoalteromonas sp. CST5]